MARREGGSQKGGEYRVGKRGEEVQPSVEDLTNLPSGSSRFGDLGDRERGISHPTDCLKFPSSRISFEVGALAPRRSAGPLYSHETPDVRHGLEKLAGALGFVRSSPSWMALARSSFISDG